MASIELLIAIGIFIGFVFALTFFIILGKDQKLWHELTYEEKKNRKMLIGTVLIILIICFVTGLWQFRIF